MTATAHDFLTQLDALHTAADDKMRPAIGMLAVATRCRLGEGIAELGALPESARLHVLKLLVSVMPPTPALRDVALRAVMDADSLWLAAEPELSERIMAVWSGLSPAEAGWSELTQADRFVCITRLVAAGYPPSAEFEPFLRALTSETDREAAIVAWCRERDWSASEAENAWLRHTQRPMARLEAMASVLSRVTASHIIASEWLGDAERAWQEAPRDNLGRALADARFSAVLSAAGDLASAEGLLGHALAGAARENEPLERARIYRVAFEAAAGLARHDARGTAVEPWLGAVEKLMNDKALLRHREVFLDARAAAVRTLPRAVMTGGEVAVDRGHQLLKELCRRLPERWLDLLHWATVGMLQARAGRSSELLVQTIGDALKKDGLPRPIPAITADEILRRLTPVAPDQVLALGERLAHPVQRALWWSSAAPFCPGPSTDAETAQVD